MHELALARSLTEMVDQYAVEQGVTHIKQVNIRLGTLSGMTRALYFCFGSASKGTSCEGASLNIDEIPITVFCRHCNDVKEPNGRYNFRCPDCGMPTPDLVTGRETELVSIELYSNSSAARKPLGAHCQET